jgi:hypothetical protein
VPYAGNASASGTERFEQLLLSLPPDECGSFLKPASAPASAVNLSIPERGIHMLQTIVETMGGHDLNHLSQLEYSNRLQREPD